MLERVSTGDTEVVIVGTAHVSEESAAEVRRVIDEESPDVVCVELDEKRYESMTAEDQWKNLEVKDALKQGKGHMLLMNVLLSIYQRKLGEQLDITPGSEMLAAVEAAEERELPVELIDRDIEDTLRDALNSLSITEKFKLLTYGVYGFLADEELTEDQIEELKESTIVDNLVEELGDQFPSLKETFLDKRDMYMAENIRQIDADKVVAVVGAAHVNGMKRILEDNTPITVSEPEQRLINPMKVIKYGIPALIVGMFSYILYSLGPAAARDAFIFWFLINAFLAGTGAIIARAHTGTVITAALAAPFASINPAMPTGLVAAYVENRFHPPKVGDLENIGSIATYKEMWSNTALRLLLIFFLVNMGSAIGSYVGAGYLANVLAGA